VVSATLGLHGPKPNPQPGTRTPGRIFKVVDVVTGRTIVEDASTNATVDALTAVESIFDVLIFVWIPEPAGWRQLTPGEHRILWDFRGR
jgi:hypothetical protein